MYKQAVILRGDLGVSRGKLCAQACHAALGAWLVSDVVVRKKWCREGERTICLKSNSEKSLVDLSDRAKKLKLPFFLVSDAGFTEVPPGTLTALGIGPDDGKKVDKLCGPLPLLK